ncbi:hypothetical protein ABK040_007171 [Willaertia magna]
MLLAVYTKADCTGIIANKNNVMNCETTVLSGLQFCSFMNGKKTDKAFNSKIISSNETYADYVDFFLEESFEKMRGYLAKEGMPVCGECLERLKILYCANAFPAEGYVSCLSNSLLKYLGEIGNRCSGFCCAKDSGLCLIDSNGKSCTINLDYSNVGLLACMAPSLGNLFSKLKECNKHFIRKALCTDAMATCGCSVDSKFNDVCDRFFSDNGVAIDSGLNYPKGQCSSTPGWCSSGSCPTTTMSTKSLDGLQSTENIFTYIEGIFGNRKQSTRQIVIGTNPELKACTSKVWIGAPVPFLFPTLKSVSFEPPAMAQLESYSKRLACSNNTCVYACTNPKSFEFNPAAEADAGKCNVDPFAGLVYVSENIWWIATLAAIAVLLVLCCLVSVMIFCIYRCCCRQRVKMLKQQRRKKLEKGDRVSRLQNAAESILNKL